MNWINAYSYYSSRSSVPYIILALIGAAIGIAILVYFMVYLYRIERNTRSTLWYLQLLTRQQPNQNDAPTQSDPNTAAESAEQATPNDTAAPAPFQGIAPEQLTNDKESSPVPVIFALCLVGFLIIAGIVSSVT